MSITQERKAELIGEYSTGEHDTGSPEVQVLSLIHISEPTRPY